MIKVEKKLIHTIGKQTTRNKKDGQGWIFVNSGNEMEHETFLATWLAEIDFSPNGLVSKFVFLTVTLWSPFYYLVYIWVWERFSNLQPQPRLINHEKPMLCRWHKLNPLKIEGRRFALDSARDYFPWHPYVQYVG
ncbi:hypothetical protein GmHk_18G051817 [Glycine max]|nr:hypothetical protein GmHk_18G051817 [Glycine max]